MCGNIVDIQSAATKNKRGKKEERKKQKPQLQNIMWASMLCRAATTNTTILVSESLA